MNVSESGIGGEIDGTEDSLMESRPDETHLFKNVMRKPKPMKIITWTSWNTEKGKA